MVMLNYVIVEVSGKQYKIEPGKEYLVDLLETEKTFETDKILLESTNGNIKFGAPYLKKILKFEVLGSKSGDKIRVAKYSAKANYRKVKGSTPNFSRIKLIVDSREKA